jgi:hypothetical protein
MRVGKHLAVACLLFGLGVAAFVSGSLEQRIGNLFCVGLIPAVGFYAGGHILGQLLMFGVELCDMIMARCFRYAVRLVNHLLSWGGTHVSMRSQLDTRHALFAAEQQNSHFSRPIR